MPSAHVAPVLMVALLVGLSGCLGADDDKKVATTFVAETVQGVENIPPLTLDDLEFSPAGAIRREVQEDPPAPPVVGPMVFGMDYQYRLLWNVTNLVPVGEGTQGKTVDELFYSVWLLAWHGNGGGPDTFVYEKFGTQFAASDGKIEGLTNWHGDHGLFRGMKVTLETVNDQLPEITVLEVTDLPFNETGEWPLVDIKAFVPAWGEGRAVANAEARTVTVSVETFDLPETQGVYDLFLQTPGAVTYLATLKADADPKTRAAQATLPLDAFTTWSVFVTVESKDPDKQLEFSKFRVLVSRFVS